jgi:glycerol-3-phosphate dehydrogenase
MEYDVVVIGGGATGTSILSYLSMYGIDVALIERSLISGGTTKHSHQNLVGGLRYVVNDPEVARDCAQENKTISEMYPDIVGKSRCYFLGFQSDYTELAIHKAKQLGVVTNRLDPREVLEEIPGLNPEIDVAYETEDRIIDAEEFCRRNCLWAILNGGELYEETEIISITENEPIKNYTIKTRDEEITTRCIINATGPWANSITQMVGVTIPLSYVQGTVIVQEVLSKRSIQYFRPPSNGDAYIVHDSEAWLGTTSVAIHSPDSQHMEIWAGEYLTEQFAQILPGVLDQKILRSFVGVRPLYNELGNWRNLSRDYQIIESPPGFFTVTGGKLTTARLMAEKTSEVASAYLMGLDHWRIPQRYGKVTKND